DRARAALRQAATRAEALHAPQRALAHLERALDLSQAATERAMLAEDAALAPRAAARFSTADQHLRTAIELREGGGDASGAAARNRAQLARGMLKGQRTTAAP